MTTYYQYIAPHPQSQPSPSISSTSRSKEPQAHPASLPTPSQTLHLLHLPYELRLQIYTHALTPPHPARLPPTPALLLASRALYAETCPVLYATSTFLLHDSLLAALPRPYAAPAHLLAHLGPLARASIRKWQLRIRLDCALRFAPAAAAEQLSGVAELGVEAWTAAFGVVGCWNLVHGLGQVRGVRVCRVEGSVRNGDEEGAADWVERIVCLKAGEAPGARWEGEGKVGGIEVGEARTWIDRG